MLNNNKTLEEIENKCLFFDQSLEQRNAKCIKEIMQTPLQKMEESIKKNIDAKKEVIN